MQFNDNNIYNLFQKVEGLDKVEGMDEGFVGRTGQGLVTVRDEWQWHVGLFILSASLDAWNFPIKSKNN